MEKNVLKVDGMSCDHCVKAVTEAVGALPGVDKVTVVLADKTVTVEYDPAKCPLDKIKSEIDDQGFEVVG